MLVMSKRVFLSVRGLAVHLMASFPGLGPSVRHTPLANRSIAGSPLDRTPGKSPMLSSTVSGPSPLNEATPQSKAPPSHQW